MLADALATLGGRAAFVVHGHGGLDELTTSGPNRVSHLKDGYVRTYDLDASDLGLRPASPDDLRGGEAEENARLLRQVLNGQDTGPRRDVVLLNAAAALAAQHGDLALGLREAAQSIDSGAALSRLENLAAFSQGLGAVQ
jgi:anthranilate phosphoribosyltransferase